jgi:hypothetical protein
MRLQKIFLGFLISLFGLSINAENVPKVFLLDARHLAEVREQIKSGNAKFNPALERLERDANKALKAGPFTVVDKIIPPGGNDHDYVTQAPYFWRNPDSSDGLPYVRRDGERNPEIDKYPDHRSMDEMVEAVETLSFAWYFKNNERFANRAAVLVRAWFLDPATFMNPSLNYAQFIPGANTGRGIGIIETRGFVRLVDSVGLLANSKAWTSSDQKALERWFEQYLEWLLTSKNGRAEAAAKNNHGTYYDLQVASYALFVGQTHLAQSILREAGSKRIAAQISSDGQQPLEIARTKSWSYSVGNLQGLFSLAKLAEKNGVDLWNYEAPGGASIRKGFDYLFPIATGDRNWPHKQLGGVSRQALYPLVRIAVAKYAAENYIMFVRKLPEIEPDSRTLLLNRQFGH